LKGINFRSIYFVIQYGICAYVAELIQRGGRGGRDDDIMALFLIMYESWVLDLDVSHVTAGQLKDDPDHPYFTGLKKNLTKKERAGIASIVCIQSPECIRQIFAEYLDDTTLEGTVGYLYSHETGDGSSGDSYPHLSELSGVVANEDGLSVGVDEVSENEPNREAFEREAELVDNAESCLDFCFFEPAIHGIVS